MQPREHISKYSKKKPEKGVIAVARSCSLFLKTNNVGGRYPQILSTLALLSGFIGICRNPHLQTSQKVLRGFFRVCRELPGFVSGRLVGWMVGAGYKAGRGTDR